MAAAVYLLCALTSIVCATLLIRAYRANRARLLFWSSVCFIGLALNNVLVFIDLIVVPQQIDLRVLRDFVALIAMAIMLFGLIWDQER